MLTPGRRRLRRLRLAITVLLAGGIVLLATLVGLLQLMLPLVERYPDRVAAFLSERMQRPVSVDSVAGAWEGAGPVLRLGGVHIAGATPNAPPFVIPQAELVVDFTAWSKKNRRWNEFRLTGLDLQLTRGLDRRWQLLGFSATDTGGEDGDNPLLNLGAVVVRDTHVRILDVLRNLDFGVHADEVRLLNWGDYHTLLGRVRSDRSPTVPVELVANYDVSNESGQFYVGGSAIDLAGLLKGLDVEGQRLDGAHGKVQLWGAIGAAQLISAHAAFDLRDIAVAPADSALAELPGFGRLAHLAGVARWQHSDSGWTLDVADLRAARAAIEPAASALRVEFTARDDAPGRYDVTAQHLELSTLANIGALPGALGSSLRRLLHLGEPHGQIDGLELHVGTPEELSYRADFSGVGLTSVERTPGVDALAGSVAGDADAGVVRLPEQAATVRYPREFREPFAFARFGGDVAFYRVDDAWRIETPAFVFDAKEFGGELRGGVELPDAKSKPLLDLAAVITHADVTAAKLFWPLTSMSKKSMEWLDRALVSGRVDSANVVVHGDLDDWPFKNLAGRFDGIATVSDAVLVYHPEWPRAQKIDAVAEFANTSMHIDASSVSSLGLQVSHAVADIPDIGESVLGLSVQGAGTGPQLLAFLNATPIGKRHVDELRDLRIGGKGEFDFTLELPTKQTEDLQLAGRVQLAGADLDQPQWRQHFDDASGPVVFSQKGLHAGPLALGLRGRPAVLDLALGAGYVASQANAVEARLQGDLPMETVFADAEALRPLWAFFPGSSQWNVALDVPAGGGASVLSMSSDLRGTAVTLPVPLAKPAGDALPATLRLPLPVTGASLEVALGDVVRLHARLADTKRPLAIAVNFDAVMPTAEQMPDAGLVVGGHAARIDLSGWTTFGFGNGGGGLPLRGVDVGAAKAELFGREFDDLQLRIVPGTESTEVHIAGAELEGSLQIPSASLLVARGVSAHFKRLHWPDAPRGETDDADADDAPADSGFLPASLPPLHLSIEDFRLGQARFGKAALDSHPTAQGMHFDRVETDSDDIRMFAQGDWNGDLRGTRSNFVIDFSAEDLGRMLGAFGFAGVVDGGKTQAHIAASWAGSPSGFALARLDGTMKISVAEGRILDVNTPAMGRIFGLLSLSEIPRRLSLDFGDFFRSGFSFNAITGEFQLRDGSAFTQNLHIASPAADVHINGRTGLKSKDYDQQMVVTPHVGGALPVVGAIAGGPAGAAAGLAVQTLFNRAINHVTTARYKVTGSWDKPEITLIAREGSRRPAEAKPVPGKEKSG